MTNYLNRLCWTLIGTLLICLTLALTLTIESVIIRASVDAKMEGNK